MGANCWVNSQNSENYINIRKNNKKEKKDMKTKFFLTIVEVQFRIHGFAIIKNAKKKQI